MGLEVPPYYKTRSGETYENTEEYDIHRMNSLYYIPLDTNFDPIVDTPNTFSGFGHGGHDSFDGGGASQSWSDPSPNDASNCDGGSSCSSSCGSGCGGGGD